MSQESNAKKTPIRRNERNALTFYEKIAVIRYAEYANISRNRLARMFHCCVTQIRRILERKTELLQHLATLNEADAFVIIEEVTRKRRKFETSAVGFILHKWVERCRQLRLAKRITDCTLNETAMRMAAILNLPSFRPSRRWLQHFRSKYKYNDDHDLGAAAQQTNTVPGELAIEDIIIEFKDALPSFMQKEISSITGASKCVEAENVATSTEQPTAVVNCDDSDDTSEESSEEASEEGDHPPEGGNQEGTLESREVTPNSVSDAGNLPYKGSDALLGGLFPHLAVIHQFALINGDAKALELLSRLELHMQQQAAIGVYKSPAGSCCLNNNNNNAESDNMGAFEDIVLVE